MELRQLRYFLAAAKHLNFTKAAEEVHIAQPPFGRQIASLEAELGSILLNRDGRGMSLTAAGNLVAQRAEEILGALRRLREDVAALTGNTPPPFRIGAAPWLLYGHIAHGIAYMRREIADVDVDLAVYPEQELIDRLLARDIDMAVGGKVSARTELEQAIVRYDTQVLAIPARTGIAGLGGRDDASALRDTAIVQAGASTPTVEVAAELLARAGLRPTRTIPAQNLETALGLVASGIGVAIVPSLARRMRGEDVTYLELEGPKIPVMLSVLRGANSAVFAGVVGELKRIEGEFTPARVAPGLGDLGGASQTS